jgi:hypothetical protein
LGLLLHRIFSSSTAALNSALPQSNLRREETFRLDRCCHSQQRNRADWQLLKRPLGVTPGRLFPLTWEGDMPNDKPLKPDDFPVEVEGEKLVTADGKPIAKAKTPAIAEDIADRLNEDDCRKELDKWSA